MDLPKRKKIRLEGYDYSSCGAYFVTVCITDRQRLLCENVEADTILGRKIRPNTLTLSEYGKIVDTAINAIPTHYENVYVDRYCIMPDHVHIIILILPDENGRMISAPTLSTVIGQMKRWVSKQIGLSIWQKSFYEKIIHDEEGYQEVLKYIDGNPLQEDESYQ